MCWLTAPGKKSPYFFFFFKRQVQLLYNDDSLEFKISFVLKRLEILHTDSPQLQRSHDIDRYLNSFCTWQEKENNSLEKTSLHWDHALMLTGLDLYAIAKSGKFSNQVLGQFIFPSNQESKVLTTLKILFHFRFSTSSWNVYTVQ